MRILYPGLLVLLIILAVSCRPGHSVLKAIANSNPEKLVMMSDSLLSEPQFRSDTVAMNILAGAHAHIARTHMKNNNLSEALEEIEKASELSAGSGEIAYLKYILEGHVNFKHGNLWKLWDAIGLYTKAAEVFPDRGEPYYWIARTYEKKDGRDYESIIEAYEKALALLDEGFLMEDAGKRLDRIRGEKAAFEKFWR